MSFWVIRQHFHCSPHQLCVLLVQILVIDFGKTTKTIQGKFLYLSQQEKLEYQQKYPQVAPEVVEGEMQQSTFSDVYAIGVLYQITESGCISFISHSKTVLNITEKCRFPNYLQRSTIKQALNNYKTMLLSMTNIILYKDKVYICISVYQYD